MIRLCTQVLMIIFLVSATHAQSAKHLWVLQEPNEIVEYDVSSFTARRTVKVPHRLFEAPEYLSINGKGLMLFLPPAGVHWASGEMALAGDRVWFWDGHQAKEWSLEGTKTRGDSAGKPALVETMPQCFLSVGGELAGARLAVARIKDPWTQATATAVILGVQARKGDVDGALSAAQALLGHEAQAVALVGVAIGQAM